MPGYTFQLIKESENRTWSYKSITWEPGWLRLLPVSDLLKDDPTLILSEWRGLDITNPGKSFVPKYATISHSWAVSDEVQRLSEIADRPFRIDLGNDQYHTISWEGLVQAAKAAQHLGCDFLWLDLACVHQDSSEDKKLQIQHMGHVYQRSVAVIVMPGGVASAQGVGHSAPWITRAWTLQEATLSPSKVHVLIKEPRLDTTNYDYEFMTIGPTYRIDQVDDDLALSKLQDLLTCRKRGLEITKVNKSTKEKTRVPFIVRCFGADEALITALEGVLRGDTDEMKRSAAWRSIYLRTSTKPQDMVFSVMHLLGVDIKVDYKRTREDLILELARRTKGLPSWLDIGEDIPFDAKFGLVPALPIFHPNDRPSYDVDHELVPANRYTESGTYIKEYDIKIQTSPTSTFDGDLICAKIFPITFRNASGASITSDSGETFTFNDVDQMKVTGSHVVVLGEAKVYGFGHLGLATFGGPQVIFVGRSERGIWERHGKRAVIPEKFVENSTRWHLKIGGKPGSEIKPCDCLITDIQLRTGVVCK